MAKETQDEDNSRPCDSPSHNQLHDDSVLQILGHLAATATLSELMQKSFISQQWYRAVGRLMYLLNGTSLKLFKSEVNFERYQRLMRKLKLFAIDPKFELHDEEQADWTVQDHLCLQHFTGVSLETITAALGTFFPNVNHLVIGTFDIDQVKVLQAFPKLVTLTLVELPEDRRLLNAMWQQMAQLEHLKHLHIFHCESQLPLDPVQLRPVLGHLVSFTLYGYVHFNRMKMVASLDPSICRHICFGNFDLKALFPLELEATYPELARYLVMNKIVDVQFYPPPFGTKDLSETRQLIDASLKAAFFKNDDDLQRDWNWVFNGAGTMLGPDFTAAYRRMQAFRRITYERFSDLVSREPIIDDLRLHQRVLNEIIRQLIASYRRGEWQPTEDEDERGIRFYF